MISSPVNPLITVIFATGSQYNFAINFNFGSATGLFIFQFAVRINSNYANFFTPKDLQQVQVITINMASTPFYNPIQGLQLTTDA